MKTFFLFLLSLICVLPFAEAQEWERAADLPAQFLVHHGVGFAIDGKGYLVTGEAPDGYRKDMYQYDPATDQWVRMPDFPGPARSFAIGDTYNGKAYMGFGVDNQGNDLNDLWMFDPKDTSWTQLESCDCPGRAHPAFVAQNGKIFMGLGNNQNNLRDWWVYDMATDSWQQGADFPAARRHHPFQFGIGDDIYAGLGHGDFEIFDEWYRYDPELDQWTQVENIPAEGRVAGTQFSYDNKGYVLSGDGDDHSTMPTGEFWEYQPEADRWNQLPPHPGISRWAPSSFVVNDEVYFMGGIERTPYNYTNVVWKYSFFSVRAEVVNRPICTNEATGAVNILVNGDTTLADLSIIWENGDTTFYRSGLVAGTYNATVIRGTDTTDYSFTLEAEDNLMYSGRTEAISCHGDDDGSIALNIINGVPPFNLQWQDGDSSLNRTNLQAGWYTFELTDSNACRTYTDSFLIEEPDPIVLTIDSVQDTDGSRGEIFYSLSGGTGNIILRLVNEEGDTIFSNFNGSSFRNLRPGNYTIRLADENGCTFEVEDIVVELTTSAESSKVVQWTAYPNPANNVFYLKNPQAGEFVRWGLYDVNGTKIKEIQAFNLVTRINVGDLSPGIYVLLPLDLDQKLQPIKFLKQ